MSCFATASAGHGYEFGSQRCQAMIAYGGAPELSDEEVRRLDAQDLAQCRDNVAAGRHPHNAVRTSPTWVSGDTLLNVL